MAMMNNNQKRKYTTNTWNKRKTVRTYSKTRPSQIKIASSVLLFDEIVRESNRKNEADAETEPEKKDFEKKSIESEDLHQGGENGNENHDKIEKCLPKQKSPQLKSFQIISSEKENSKELPAAEDKFTDYAVDMSSSPGSDNTFQKNSTCIEGGVKFDSPGVLEPPLSPISGEKTDMRTMSMELTNPCAPDTKSYSSNCLSSIGKSTPYMLAALRVKKTVRRSRKVSVAPFVKQALRNIQKSNLKKKMLADTPKFSSRARKEGQKENNMPVSSTPCMQHECISQISNISSIDVTNKEKEPDGHKNISTEADARHEVLDSNTSYSTIHHTVVKNKDEKSQENIFPDELKKLKLHESSALVHERHLSKNEEDLQESTPEDKNVSLKLREQTSLKSRRSLSYMKSKQYPTDPLIAAPLRTEFKKVKMRIKRDPNWLTSVGDREQYPIDDLVLC